MNDTISALARCAAITLGGMLLVVSFPAAWDESWYPRAFAETPSAAETQAFEDAKSLGTVEAWDAFLTHYPTGFHADLARAYVKQLATKAPSPPVAQQAAGAEQPAYEQVCEGREGLKSHSSREPAKLRFINESGTTLVLQWVDYNGALKEYGTLAPGAEITQDTYITHPWITAYQEGSCRQIFLPAPGLSVARLLPENRLPSSRKASRADDSGDHGSTPEQTCKDIGQDYNGKECVPRKKKSASPSKTTVERRAKTSCADIGMIYLNGKCAPKKKAERDSGTKNKNKACPAGMYRNPYGQCQPNETGG